MQPSKSVVGPPKRRNLLKNNDDLENSDSPETRPPPDHPVILFAGIHRHAVWLRIQWYFAIQMTDRSC
jgi:hypothetical protein